MSYEKWKCSNCGTENAIDDNFCGECGTKRPEVKAGIGMTGKAVVEKVELNPKPGVGIGKSQRVEETETLEKETAISGGDESEKPEKKGLEKIAMIFVLICAVLITCGVVFVFAFAVTHKNEEASIRRHQCESADRLFPCKDNSTGLFWSSRSSDHMTWSAAKKYCEDYSEGNISAGWRLPNIDELRTLIQDHPGMQSGGSCPISDREGKLSWSDRTSDCDGRDGSNFSKLGDAGYYWSSSTLSGDSNYAWYVNFGRGNVLYDDKTANLFVRCVR